MTREQAINYLICRGLTQEQVGDVVRALTYEPARLSVEEVTALAEWTEKLTKASEDAYNKGFADGANEVLDKLRAEIETKYGQCDICEYFEDYDYEENDISEYKLIGNIADILQMIDKYKGESEDGE